MPANRWRCSLAFGSAAVIWTRGIGADFSSLWGGTIKERWRNPNLLRRSAMDPSAAAGRALRYAGGSARGLLRHLKGHGPGSGRQGVPYPYPWIAGRSGSRRSCGIRPRFKDVDFHRYPLVDWRLDLAPLQD